MITIYIALAALLGGVAAALLGWLESSDPFNPRKFGGSVIRSLMAAAIFAAGYQLSSAVGVIDLVYAFLGGAGVDVIGNRISGKLGNSSFPLTKPPETPGEGGS
ncbi:MAG: hypothetical protein U1B77_01105 [Dehalococcoidales bacterium]|nr:hypothetical protein [Dehalococcoidales bacterium]